MFQASFGPASFGLRTTTGSSVQSTPCTYTSLAIGLALTQCEGVLVQVIVYGHT